MDTRIFKAYDVRGQYPEEINERTVRVVAEALGRRFGSGTVVVGHDGRTSSPALSFAVKRGLAVTKSRATIIDIGTATTPMFYFLVNHLKTAGGIMVTASHNPKGMNGLKVVGKRAIPIGGREILKIVRHTHHA
jgi:phosphomannomutase / phosphoglucomutase